MLKVLKPETFASVANAKCGEIYFQSLNSYRIDCHFCEMKSFIFGDFLLHIQNVHFEDGLLKADVIMPKEEEQDETEPLPTIVKPVNSFTWYDIDDERSDKDPDVDSDDATDDSLPNADDNFSDVSDNVIMKWSNSNGSKVDATNRHKRSAIINYKEDSDNNSFDQFNFDTANDSKKLGSAKKTQQACPHCNKLYLSQTTLRRHILRQHSAEHSGAENTDDDVDYEPPHLELAKPLVEHKCQHCDKIYYGKYTLRQHIKRDHNAEANEVFKCIECNEQLPRQRLLDTHVLQVHGGSLCAICGRRYKTRHELKRHQLKHTNERNVPCAHAGCHKLFFSQRHMRNHIKVHSEQKNFICENCGYSCRNKETLRVHIRSHTGERPFGCNVCTKSFPSHSGLREHMAMHSTERPHVCNVCGATFSRQKGLYHHKFLHTATKQFKCKLCGNAYAQAAGLAGHMRKHRNDEINI